MIEYNDLLNQTVVNVEQKLLQNVNCKEIGLQF